MAVFGVKAHQGQAVLGACTYDSSQLILKALRTGGYYWFKFAGEGTGVRVVGWPKVNTLHPAL